MIKGAGLLFIHLFRDVDVFKLFKIRGNCIMKQSIVYYTAIMIISISLLYKLLIEY
ncbi:hypothetical protein UFO1_0346 [Pelosinus sp. UFO1]|nr:hypothetical protein UFO1_0346 [Pelosinus sp. UFO1]